MGVRITALVERLGGKRGSLPHRLTKDLLSAEDWGAVRVPEPWQHSLAPHLSLVSLSACRVGSVCEVHES